MNEENITLEGGEGVTIPDLPEMPEIPQVPETPDNSVEAAAEALRETLQQAVDEAVADTDTKVTVEAEVETEPAEEAVAEVAEPLAEIAAEPVEEVVAAEPAPVKEKKSGKGLKITIIVLLALVLAALLAVGGLLIAHKQGSIKQLFFGSADTAELPFTGVYTADNGTELAISAGGKAIMGNQVYDLTVNDGKLHFERGSETYDFSYDVTDNGITITGSDGKQTSLTAKEGSRPVRIMDVWENLDGKIELREDGTALIGGTEYTYTADAYEITCTAFGKKEYIFYELDGDKLTIYKPDAPMNRQIFLREGTGSFKAVGTWVDSGSTMYYTIREDGSVTCSNSLMGMLGLTMKYEDDKLKLGMMGFDMNLDCSIEGNVMTVTIDLLGSKETLTMYKVSTSTNLTAKEVDTLWKEYTAANGIYIPSDTDLSQTFDYNDILGSLGDLGGLTGGNDLFGGSDDLFGGFGGDDLFNFDYDDLFGGFGGDAFDFGGDSSDDVVGM